MDTSLHALVPYGSSREPGLILLSPGGAMWFWDSLAMGLAGGEPSFISSLSLNFDERATTLTRADVWVASFTLTSRPNFCRLLYSHKRSSSPPQ